MFESLLIPLVLAIVGSSSISTLVIYFVTRKDDKQCEREKVEELIQFKYYTEEKIKDLSAGHVALLHNSLFKTASEYLARGYITLSELDNLKYLFDSYHTLGGNGTGDLIMRKIDQLEIRED